MFVGGAEWFNQVPKECWDQYSTRELLLRFPVASVGLFIFFIALNPYSVEEENHLWIPSSFV